MLRPEEPAWDVHLFHHTFLREEQARELAHTHLPVVKPHDITPGDPSEDHIMERRTTEQPNDVFAREFGFQPPLSSEDIGERLKPSRRSATRVKKARWAHPRKTGGGGCSSN